jgi:hypothetical protein
LCVNGTSSASFCINFRAVTKRSKTPHHMSFGSNGVGQVHLLRKISMQLRLVNLCVNGAILASFASTFGAVTKRSEMPQNMSFWSNGLDRVRSLRNIQTWLCVATLCVNGTCSARFASTFVQ